MNAEQILQQAVTVLDKHKGEDLLALRVAGLTSITDYFLLVTGTSATNVRSLADYAEKELAAAGKRPLRSEGYRSGEWITLDYGDVLIHIFRRETRAFYDLEHLWADAEQVDITPHMIQE